MLKKTKGSSGSSASQLTQSSISRAGSFKIERKRPAIERDETIFQLCQAGRVQGLSVRKRKGKKEAQEQQESAGGSDPTMLGKREPWDDDHPLSEGDKEQQELREAPQENFAMGQGWPANLIR